MCIESLLNFYCFDGDGCSTKTKICAVTNSTLNGEGKITSCNLVLQMKRLVHPTLEWTEGIDIDGLEVCGVTDQLLHL